MIFAGLVDGDLDFRRQCELRQAVKITAHDDQVGAAVHLFAAMVGGEPLHAAVACAHIAHAYLADAVRNDLLQVLLEHQAAAQQSLFIERMELRIERLFVVDDGLAQAAYSRRRLDANATQPEQSQAGNARIARREGRIARKNHVAHAICKFRRPSVGRARVGIG